MTLTVLAFPADSHSGSTVGLMRYKPWQLDTGGTYHPSPAQKIIWKQWVECWNTVKSLNADRLIITMMGDAIDGKHHNTSELVSQRVEEQEAIFIDVMEWTLNYVNFGSNDVLQFISGTPAHTGEMAQSERRICKDLNGKGVYDRLKFQVDGVRFDCAHDGIGVGGRVWTDDSSFHMAVKSMLFQSLLTCSEPPDFIIRAHRHRFTPTNYARGAYKINGFICPAMQLKTAYSSRMTSSNNELPDIGLLIVVVDDGKADWRCPMVTWPKDKWEKL